MPKKTKGRCVHIYRSISPYAAIGEQCKNRGPMDKKGEFRCSLHHFRNKRTRIQREFKYPPPKHLVEKVDDLLKKLSPDVETARHQNEGGFAKSVVKLYDKLAIAVNTAKAKLAQLDKSQREFQAEILRCMMRDEALCLSEERKQKSLVQLQDERLQNNAAIAKSGDELKEGRLFPDITSIVCSRYETEQKKKLIEFTLKCDAAKADSSSNQKSLELNLKKEP